MSEDCINMLILKCHQKNKFSHASEVSSIVAGLVHVHTLKIKINTGLGNLFQKWGPSATVSLCTEHFQFIMPHPSCSFRFGHPQLILGEEYRSLNFSLCSFLHTPVTSPLLGQNILLSTLFSNTLSLHSCLNVSDQVSYSHKTAG